MTILGILIEVPPGNGRPVEEIMGERAGILGALTSLGLSLDDERYMVCVTPGPDGDAFTVITTNAPELFDNLEKKAFLDQVNIDA